MDCVSKEGDGTSQEIPECNGCNDENGKHQNFALTPPMNIKTESAEVDTTITDSKSSEMTVVKEELLDCILPNSSCYTIDNSPMKCNEIVVSPNGKLQSSSNVDTKVFSSFIKEEIDIEDVAQSHVKVEAVDAVEPVDNSTSNKAPLQCINCSLTFLNQYIYKMHLKLCRVNLSPVEPVVSNVVNARTSKSNRRYYGVATTKKLIECVRNNPCLYDADSEDFNNVDLKTVTWDNIASECNLPSGAVAKSQWKALKNRLINSVTLHNSSHASPMRIQKNWQYKKQMEFVLPYVTDTDIHASMQNRAVAAAATEPQESEEVNHIDDDVDDDYTNDIQRLLRPKQISGSPQKDCTSKSAKRKRKSSIERPEPSSSQSQPLDMFFLSMCATTKNLPPYVQLQVKKKIFQAVIEAEEIVAAMHNDQAKNNMFPGAVISHDEYQNNMSPFSIHSNAAEEWQDD